MSRENPPDRDPLLLEGIEPLRSMVRRGSASAPDVELSRALDRVFPPPGARDTASDFSAIAGEVSRIAARRRRRSALRELWSGFRGWPVLAVSIGLLLLAAIGTWRLWPKAPLVIARAPATQSSPIVVGSRANLTSVKGERLDATLAGGARLNLRGSAEVDQSRPDRVLVRLLETDSEIQVEVPHLKPGESFVVSGAHADAVVHGTRFRVEDRGNAGTLVQVLEGVVEVVPRKGSRPSVFLAAGSSLLVPTLEDFLRDFHGRVRAAAAAEDCRTVESAATVALQAAPAGEDTSETLYLRAACNARKGNATAAIRDFEQAARIAKDPTRADNALARTAELHQSLDPHAGASAWRRYLRRFPNGLHRDMAERWLKSNPGMRR